MEKFTVLNGLVAPPDRANVDTDAIILIGTSQMGDAVVTAL